MKTPDEIRTVTQYIASLPAGRKEAVQALHKLIRKAAPKLKPEMCQGMIGYGVRPYETKSGCKGMWPVIGLKNQKAYVSLYLGCDDSGEGYLAERNADRLGQVNVGKSCVRFTKLEKLNLGVVDELVTTLGES